MTSTPITDGFTLKNAVHAAKASKQVEILLEEAERILKDKVEPHTYAELPNLEDAMGQATALTDDINEAIDDFVQCVEGRPAAE